MADDANLLETLQRLASEGGDCLIIFDNATSPSAVHRFVPNGNTHILFTSNSPNWKASAKTQAIDSWSSEVGARYLVRRLGRDTSITAARRLTGDLGGLPLALELAASYCERRGVTIVEYRQRLASDPSKHLLAGDHTVPGYPHTVAAAYALSMAAASAEHHAALPVLQLLSFLAPSAIPTRLLDDARTTIGEYLGADIDGHATEAAIAALHNHSLLNRTMIDTAPLGNPYKVVLVHRLIGLVSRANTSAVHDACEAIARALILALPEKQHHAHRELGYRELIARHVEHMLEAEGSVRLSRDTVATLHGRYALIKVVTGGAPIALQHARKSLRLNAECHGSQSLPFAMALYVLGVVLLAIRKPRSARIVHCEALAITTRHRGEFHPDAAEIRAAIAETFIFEDDLVAAESLLKEITVARMRYWPADDPESADMLLRLCSTQIQMGRYADALPSIAEASLMLAASVPPDDDRLIDLRVHVVPTTGQAAGQDASIVGELRAWVVKLAKSREDQPEHVAAALMHIGIAAASRHDPSGWLLLDDALRRMSDPSLNRCWGLLQRSRLQPEAEHAIQDARASLSEAERLDDATAIESAARTLHHLLKAESRQDEADVVRNTHLA